MGNLVLTRKLGECVVINGNIRVRIAQTGEKVRLAIEAPEHIEIHREEVYNAIRDRMKQGGPEVDPE